MDYGPGGLLGGSDAVLGLNFDFYIDPGNDNETGGDDIRSLRLYLTGDNGAKWFWDIEGFEDGMVSDNAWHTYGANLGSSYNTGFGSWYRDSGDVSEMAWQEAIGGVVEIGVEAGIASSGNNDTHYFYLDNFTADSEPFLTPEPEEYAILAFTLLSMGIVFRKRLQPHLGRLFS